MGQVLASPSEPVGLRPEPCSYLPLPGVHGAKSVMPGCCSAGPTNLYSPAEADEVKLCLHGLSQRGSVSVEKLFSEGEDRKAVLPLSANGLTMEFSLLPQVLGGLPHSQ